MGKLDDKRFNGYLAIRIPHNLDRVVDDYIHSYRSASSERQMELIEAVSHRAASVLSAYAQRMAVAAVRHASEDPLARAVIAIGIAEACLPDTRENLKPLAAMHHSAKLLGKPLEEMVMQEARNLPSASLIELQKFIQRNERNKSLEAMRLGTQGAGETFIYVPA